MADWFTTEVKRMPFYRMAQRTFQSTLMQAVDTVAESIKAGNIAQNAENAVLTVTDALKSDLVKVYDRVGLDFLDMSFRGMRKVTNKQTGLEPNWERYALFYIQQNRFPLITTVEETLKKRIDGLIRAGVADGLGSTEIARLIRDSAPKLTLSQAVRIARTEVINASNMGSQYGLQATGLSLDKEWIATMDNRTREDHIQADAQMVGLDQPFILSDGSRLMWPGDNSFGAPAGQTINCRCTEGGVTR